VQGLLLVMIVVATTFDFLAGGDSWGRLALLPREAKLVADLFGAIALAAVAVVGTRNSFRFVRPAYWVIFGALVVVVVCGIIVNNVEAGPIVAGLRGYLRAMPWFFVAAIYSFTDPDIKKQLQVLLAIGLLQVPLAIEQRIKSLYAGMGAGQVNYTGDFTTGTMPTSHSLSIFMIAGMCMLVAMYSRGLLRSRQFIPLFILFLVPIVINETKATIVLLPVGVLVTFIAAARAGRKLRAALIGCLVVVLGVAVFVPVYDSLRSEGQPGITEFLTEPELAEQYLWKKEDVGTTREKPAGRMDAVLVTLRHLSADPATLAFGYGIGNASDSALGAGFAGRYFMLFEPFMTNAFARITLELGLTGFGLVLTLMWMVYRDGRVVARLEDGAMGAIGAAMAGITAVFVVVIAYRDVTGQMSLSFVYWFYAGLVSAHRMRMFHLGREGEHPDRQCLAFESHRGERAMRRLS